MGNINLIKNKSIEILYRELDESFTKEILSLLKCKEYINIAICGGRAVEKIFNKWSLNKQIDWSRIHIFLVDERFVPLDNIESNYKLAFDNFLGDLINQDKIKESNIHKLKYYENDIQKSIEEYNEKLNVHGGRFDISLLSAGEDGHIAALYPNHKSILTKENKYLGIDDSPKPPSKRITASFELISTSKVIYMMLIGTSKKPTLDLLLSKELKDDYVSLPARIIYKVNKSYLITDQLDD